MVQKNNTFRNVSSFYKISMNAGWILWQMMRTQLFDKMDKGESARMTDKEMETLK